MNKVLKKVSTILTILVLVCAITNTFVYAQSGIPNPGDYEPSGGTAPTEVTNMFGTIASIIQTVGIVLSVAVIIVLGIKYMVGSAEARADYKKTMIPYLIGTILIFATGSILKLIYSLTENSIE